MKYSTLYIPRRKIGRLPKSEISRTMGAGTVREAADAFYKSSEFLVGAPKTRTWKRYGLERFCNARFTEHQTFGELLLRNIGWEHLDTIIVSKIDKPGACDQFIRVMRIFISFCLRMGLIDHDPTLEVEVPVSKNPNGWDTWTEEHIATYEAKYPIGTLERTVLALALYTALRRADLVALKREHIRNGRIVIRPQKSVTKKGATLIIPIHPELAKILETIPKTQRIYLLHGKRGRPFKADNLSCWFLKVCKRADLPPGLSLHGLRKAACRRFAEAGCSPLEIMSITGHTTLREVERYTRAASREHMARAAIDSVIRAFHRPAEDTPPGHRLAVRDHIPDSDPALQGGFWIRVKDAARASAHLAGVVAPAPCGGAVVKGHDAQNAAAPPNLESVLIEADQDGVGVRLDPVDVGVASVLADINAAVAPPHAPTPFRCAGALRRCSGVCPKCAETSS